jgi:hypothetical protein
MFDTTNTLVTLLIGTVPSEHAMDHSCHPHSDTTAEDMDMKSSLDRISMSRKAHFHPAVGVKMHRNRTMRNVFRDAKSRPKSCP